MAWITNRERDFLVRWRDQDGKTRSRCFAWDKKPLDPETVAGAEGLVVTREAAEGQAQAFKREVQKTERSARGAYERMLKQLEKDPTYTPTAQGIRSLEPEYAFANYLRTIIESDKELRDSSRATYLHSLRNHIERTPLGSTDIREVSSDDVAAFWSTLHGGRAFSATSIYCLLKRSTTQCSAGTSTSHR
jgi:hypothetical protein